MKHKYTLENSILICWMYFTLELSSFHHQKIWMYFFFFISLSLDIFAYAATKTNLKLFKIWYENWKQRSKPFGMYKKYACRKVTKISMSRHSLQTVLLSDLIAKIVWTWCKIPTMEMCFSPQFYPYIKYWWFVIFPKSD